MPELRFDVTGNFDAATRGAERIDSAFGKLRRSAEESGGAISRGLGKGFDVPAQKSEDLARRLRDLSGTAQSVGLGLGAIGATITGALGVAVAKSISFESAFTGVRKTLDASEPVLEGIRRQFEDLSTEIPTTFEELSAVGEIAGQLGVEAGNVATFTEAVVRLGESSNLTSEEGAQMLARFSNITGEPIENIGNIASAIVALGNSSATSEAEIAQMALRIASSGRQAGASSADILGMATALSSVGLQAEAGGTAISAFLDRLTAAVATGGEDLEALAAVANKTAAEFKATFEGDAAEAVRQFLVGLGEREGPQAILTLKELDITERRLRDTLLRAAGGAELFGDAIERARINSQDMTALLEESNRRFATTESNLQEAKNAASLFAATIGENLKGALDGAAGVAKTFLVGLTDLARAFPNATGAVTAFLGVIGLGAAGGGGLLFLLGSLGNAIVGLKPLLAALVPLFTNAAAAARIFHAALGPIGIAVAAATIFYQLQREELEKLETQYNRLTPKTRDLTDTYKNQNPEAAKLAEAVKNLNLAAIDTTASTIKLTDADLELLGATKQTTSAVADATTATSAFEKAVIEQIKKLKEAAENQRVLDEATRRYEASLRNLATPLSVLDAISRTAAEAQENLEAGVDANIKAGRIVVPVLKDINVELPKISTGAEDAARQTHLFGEVLDDLKRRAAISNEMNGLLLWLQRYQDEVDLARRLGEDWVDSVEDGVPNLDAMRRTAETMTPSINAAGQAIEDAGNRTRDANPLIQQISTAWTDFGKSVADSIVDLDFSIDLLKDFGKVLLRIVTENAIGKITKALGGLISKLPGLGGLAGIFGGGRGGGTSLPAPGIPGGIPIPGIPAPSGGAAGGVGGLLGGGLLGTIFGGISAGTGIFGLFQGARREDTLNAIEKNTRFAMLFLGERGDQGILGVLFRILDEIAFGTTNKAVLEIKDNVPTIVASLDTLKGIGFAANDALFSIRDSLSGGVMIANAGEIGAAAGEAVAEIAEKQTDRTVRELKDPLDLLRLQEQNVRLKIEDVERALQNASVEERAVLQRELQLLRERLINIGQEIRATAEKLSESANLAPSLPARGRGGAGAAIPEPPTRLPPARGRGGESRDISDMITQLGGDFVDLTGETTRTIQITEEMSEVFRQLRRTEGNLVGEFTRRRFAEDVTIQQQKELERAGRLRFVAEQGLRFGTISVTDAVSLLTQAEQIARDSTAGLGGAVEQLASAFADTVSTIISEIEKLAAAKEEAQAAPDISTPGPAFEDFDFAAGVQPLPLLQSGGLITRTGAAVVHQGETVLPQGSGRGGGDTFVMENSVNITVQGNADVGEIRRVVRDEMEAGGDRFRRRYLQPAIRREQRLGRL